MERKQSLYLCTLGTIHDCDDYGSKYVQLDGVQKFLYVEVETDRPALTSYIVKYPKNYPRLPFHTHPGGESYFVIER
eukprot:UN12245